MHYIEKGAGIHLEFKVRRRGTREWIEAGEWEVVPLLKKSSATVHANLPRKPVTLTCSRRAGPQAKAIAEGMPYQTLQVFSISTPWEYKYVNSNIFILPAAG